MNCNLLGSCPCRWVAPVEFGLVLDRRSGVPIIPRCPRVMPFIAGLIIRWRTAVPSLVSRRGDVAPTFCSSARLFLRQRCGDVVQIPTSTRVFRSRRRNRVVPATNDLVRRAMRVISTTSHRRIREISSAIGQFYHLRYGYVIQSTSCLLVCRRCSHVTRTTISLWSRACRSVPPIVVDSSFRRRRNSPGSSRLRRGCSRIPPCTGRRSFRCRRSVVFRNICANIEVPVNLSKASLFRHRIC